MPRPKHCRRIDAVPGSTYFKPRGIPLSELEEVLLSVDELEAIRLADLEGLYQEQAAEKMGVSRQTFGRIVAAARQKVAAALVRGKALKIEGGAIEIASGRTLNCCGCRHSWESTPGKNEAVQCPICKSCNIQEAAKGRGCGIGRGKGFRQIT
ncbi:MAG TPA: DUF134 domain-containing protein [Desulfobacterales bacterium]|nr:DUF134 domain-containing protein [Desulfobacterales bacterium]